MDRLDNAAQKRLTEKKQDTYAWSEFALSHTKGEVGDLLRPIIGLLEDNGLRVEAIHDLPGYVSLGTVDALRALLVRRSGDIEPKRRYMLQIAYADQESRVADTIVFTVPGDTTPAAFENACETACRTFSAGEYRDLDRIDVTVEMLDSIAAELGGTWEHLQIMSIVSVDADGARMLDD